MQAVSRPTQCAQSVKHHRRVAIISTHLNVKTGGRPFSGGTPSLPICRDGNVASNDWAQCQRVHAPTQRPSGASTANPANKLADCRSRRQSRRGGRQGSAHSKSVPLYPGQSHIIQVSPFVSKSVPISPSQSHHFRASSVVSQLVLLYTSQSHCVVVRLITYQSCPLCVTVPQCTSQSHRVPVSPIVSLSGSLCTRRVHCVSQSHSVPVSPIVYRSVLLCTSQYHCVLVRLIMYQSCPLCQSHRVPVSSIVYQPVPLGTSPALCVLTRPIMYQSCPLCITVPQGTSQSHCVPVPGFKVRVAQ